MMIEIEGQKVEVDDSFATLPPERQNQTVDEIAASLKPASKPAPAQERKPYGLTDAAADFNAAYQMTPLGIPARIGQMLFDSGPDAVKGIVQSGADAITAPMRAMTGELRMTDDAGRTSMDAIGEGLNMAMWASPASPAITAKQPAEQIAKSAVEASTKAANTEGNLVNQAAQRLGVQLPRSVVSDSKMVQAAGKWFEQQPIVGSPMIRASEKATQQLDDAVKGVKDAYGTGSTYGAGNEVKEATTKYAKDFLVKQENKRYEPMEAMITPNVITPLKKTGETMMDIMARRDNATLPHGPAVQMVKRAVFKQHGDKVTDLSVPVKPGDTVESVFNLSTGLNYQGIKDLRSYVRETLDDPERLSKAGMSAKDLNRIYKSLTDDLKSAVERGGGQKALAEWEKVNAYSFRASKEREALQKIVGSKEPEAIVDTIAKAAGTNSRASLNKLFQARKAVDKETWDELTSAVIEKMGRDADGNFSPERWLTERGKLSPTGKAVLFNTTGKKELMKSLDDIDTVSRRLKEINKDFGNPSGTGRSNAMLAAGAAVVKAPLRLLSGVVGGRLMAKYLSQPVEAKAVADYMKALELAQKSPSLQANEHLARRANHLARIAATDLQDPKLIDSITYQLISGQKAAADQQNNEQPGRPEGYPEPAQVDQQFNDAYLQGRAF